MEIKKRNKKIDWLESIDFDSAVERFRKAVGYLMYKGIIKYQKDINLRESETISRAINGYKSNFTEKLITEFCTFYNINIDWILYGKGNIETVPNYANINDLGLVKDGENIYYNFNADELKKELLEIYRQKNNLSDRFILLRDEQVTNQNLLHLAKEKIKKLELLLQRHKGLAKEGNIDIKLVQMIVSTIEEMEIKNITKN